MKNKLVIAGAALGLGLLAAGGFLVVRNDAPPAAPASTGLRQGAALPPAAPAHVPASATGQAAPPPWSMTQGEPAGAAALPAQDAGGKKPGLEEIQRRLAAMMANGRTPSLQEVDAVLADLQRNQGKNNVAGVDLAALRENLARAAEIQRLAKEMETLSRQPGKPDLPRMQALLAQIQQQQAGLRMDVGTKPAQPASGR